MTEVLKALQELNVYWKKIGHYNMKCRWSPPGFPGQENMNHTNYNFSAEPIETDDLGDKLNLIKFELQVNCKSICMHPMRSPDANTAV